MKKPKSNFAGKVNKDSQRQQKATTSYGHLNLPKGVSMYSPEPGAKAEFDIIPYEVTDAKHPDRDVEMEIAIPGTLWYKRPYRLHRNVGASNDSFVCLTSVGKKCPICEYRAKRLKEGAEKEETDTMKSSQRNLYILIPKNSKKHEDEPHIMDISQYNFQKLLNEELEEHEEYGNFPSLEEGYTLKVRFDSKTIGTSKPFSEASRIDFYDRKEQYTEDILDEVPNLDEVLKVLSYAELEAKFLELDEEDEGGKLKDLDDEKPTRKRKPVVEDEEEEEKPVRKRKPAPEPEEEEEEEEKPVRKKKPAPVEEEEEEDPKGKKLTRSLRKELEEEEEEEEQPKKKAGSKPAPVTVAKGGKNRCPHGHRFGVDTEKFDICDTCDEWSDCSDAKDSK